MQTNRRTALLGAAAAVATPALLLARATPALAQGAAPLAQAPGFYRFKVGSYTVTTVNDGFFRRPVEGFIRNAPLPEVQALLAQQFLPTDTLTIPFTITVLQTATQTVLFDTGTGGMNPTSQMLPVNLRAAGIDPAKVTHVVFTHFHGDHVNGLLTGADPTFPNAEIIVPATEWAWWSDEGNTTRSPEGQRGNFANAARRFAPYRAKLRQIADGAEVLPGVRAVAAYGHTPGHTCYHIADGGQQAMILADLTNRPELTAQRPDWHIVFDFDPAAAEATRKRMFDRVATDRIRVTGYHFPFPSNGYIAKAGAGYHFVPADWTSGV